MRKIVPALVAAFLATAGIGSSAQAAVNLLDFSANANCPVGCTGISYTGARLGTSTALDLDGSTWSVSVVNAGDMSGLASGDPLTIVPTTASYMGLSGTVSVPVDITKSWDGAFGHFDEHLTMLTEVSRGINQIGFVLTGVVNGGVFVDAPATMIFSLTQAGGPGNVVSASLTNFASSTVPEPATWVMMGLGFAALAYAAVRRSAKDRKTLAI